WFTQEACFGVLISDNYFCRLATTTFAGATPCGRLVRPWAPKGLRPGAGAPGALDGHGQAGPLPEEEADEGRDGGRGRDGRGDEREDRTEVAARRSALGDEDTEGVAHAA